MSEQEIIEGNKLIAEFMQAKNEFSDIYYLPEFGHYFNSYGQIELNDCFRTDELKYHSSWDWLMPVVEKIEKNFWVTTTTRRGYSAVSIHQPQRAYEKIARVDSENKLEATWKAIVEFIKWYNSC